MGTFYWILQFCVIANCIEFQNKRKPMCSYCYIESIDIKIPRNTLFIFANTDLHVRTYLYQINSEWYFLMKWPDKICYANYLLFLSYQGLLHIGECQLSHAIHISNGTVNWSSGQFLRKYGIIRHLYWQPNIKANNLKSALY